MNNKYKILILTLLGILLTIPTNLAQEKLNDKISKIEEPVEKIVITADGKDYTFQGKEAKELFNKIKKKSSHSFSWTTSDSTGGKEKVYIIKTNGDDKEIEIESEGENKIIIKSDKDLDDLDNVEGIKKKVKVEVENGNKKVTVTTTENGEKKTEVYEGNEADEYLEKMKSENKDFDISIDKDGKKVKKIIIETEKEEKNK